MQDSKTAVILRLTGVGWYVALCIGGGAVFGLMFDNKFGSEPIATIVGLAVGLVLAIAGMFKMLTAILSHEHE